MLRQNKYNRGNLESTQRSNCVGQTLIQIPSNMSNNSSDLKTPMLFHSTEDTSDSQEDYFEHSDRSEKIDSLSTRSDLDARSDFETDTLYDEEEMC